jgi:hypothetical protein
LGRGSERAIAKEAVLVHLGVWLDGYAHREAAIAERVLALVLLSGLAATVLVPRASRGIGIAVQGFALLGTCVGIFTMIIGVGPRTLLDVAIHVALVAVLVTGLIVTVRHRAITTVQ